MKVATKRKNLSYQLKLFVPIVGLLWITIISFSIIQYYREVSYRTQYLRDNMDILNRRLIALLDNGQDPGSYLDFVEDYFDKSIYESLSMSIYDAESGIQLYRAGFEAPLPDGIDSQGTILGSDIIAGAPGNRLKLNPDQTFFYSIDTTADERYIVQTLLPFNDLVMSEVSDIRWWWMFIITTCVIMSLLTFLTTRHLANNVKLLRTFAFNAANDIDFSALDKFSNDDLGEISRQIVNIYNTRKEAIANLELEHKIALRATEDRNRMRAQLTDNINHELKTPAAIIKGYLDTIVDNPEMDDQSRNHFLKKAHIQINRLCNILNDLSTMTRLEEAPQKVQLEEIDFNKFVADLAIDIEESRLAGNMEFIYDIPADCKVKANHTLLNASLTNLVKNAAAYSKGTQMGIKLMTQDSQFYTFLFWDNGVGVDEEHIPLLFDRFYRVDKGRSRKVGGTGLGLPIVRSSINILGGSISVRNRSEGGLEFIFTLSRWQPKG